MPSQTIYRDIAGEVSFDLSRRPSPPPLWSHDFTLQGVQNGLSFTRASSAGFTNSDGAWVVGGADTPRLDHMAGSLTPRGLLCEEARTNFLLNSTGPATQTVSLGVGTYTLSVVGSGSCTCAAGTAVGTGFGPATAAVPDTFTLTTAGTVVFTVSGSLSRFQCENGAFATSFIATTGSAATRSADICSVSLGGSINPQEGTFAATCVVGQGGGMVLGFDDGSGGAVTRGHFSASPSSRGLYMMIGNSVRANIQHTATIVAGSLLRVAFSYSAAGTTCAANGQIIGTSATATNGFTVSSLRVGCRFFSAATNQMNGHVQRVAYYPNALNQSQLLQLTE